MQFSGTVVEVTSHSVFVEIVEGVWGVVRHKYLVEAGYEYERYQESLKIRQGIDVEVVGISEAKRRIHLNLSRNLNRPIT